MILNSKITGQGQNVIMLHGLFGSLENMGRVSALLSEHYTIHALDLRNHGRSPHCEDMNYSLMAQDVVNYMDYRCLENAIVLGHSMGGKVAMTLALDTAERVQGLIVADIAPVLYPPRHEQIFRALQSLSLQSIKARQEAFDHLKQYEIQPEIIAFLLKNLTVNKTTGFEWRLNFPVIEREYSNLMAPIPIGKSYSGPSLFIAGGLSDYIKNEHEKIIRELFPAFVFRVLDGTSHWLHAEKPETFAGICRRFLQNIPGMED